jgi:AcrR family transcriptional regulator
MSDTKSPDAHHHGNLKEALVSYTLNAADEGVLNELSVRKAARDLGVSPGAAYRHFPDKDALIRTVAHRGFDALAERFEIAVPFSSKAECSDDARTRFVSLASEYVSFARSRPELWRLMFGPFGLTPNTHNARPSTYDWLAKILQELGAFGLIRKPNRIDQFFAWSAIHGLSDLQNSPALSDENHETVVLQQCDLILSALAEVE